MAREAEAAKRERTAEIVRRLKRAYPGSKCSLDYASPWQLLVATILSAQCTDERVNLVTPELFRRYPEPLSTAAAPRTEIERLVKSTGFFRNKAKNIQGAAERVVEAYQGQVPETMDELLTLPGVARKTASVVLHNAFHAAPGSGVGIAVDTHVTRVANRLKVATSENPVKIEVQLQKLVDPVDWGDFTHLIIDHGRAICRGRSRPLCESCVLNNICPSVFKV